MKDKNKQNKQNKQNETREYTVWELWQKFFLLLIFMVIFYIGITGVFHFIAGIEFTWLSVLVVYIADLAIKMITGYNLINSIMKSVIKTLTEEQFTAKQG